MMVFARIGAVCFVFWGAIHIVGGIAILTATGDSPERGFEFYRNAGQPHSELAGAILAYLAYGFAWIGALVTFTSIRFSWRNSGAALALNVALVGATDMGLVVFLLVPGHLGWSDAWPGLVFFAVATVFGGLGLRTTAASKNALS